MNLLAGIGRTTLALLREIGAASLFAGRAAAACVRPPFYGSQFTRQLLRIGWLSLPVVGLTAVFIGAALALNIYTGGARFNAEQFVPNIVVLGITRELGPVLAGLMLAGRVSAGLAAEIGTMRVTEQIDALTTLSVNPYKYLIVPRIIAGTVMLPVLVLIADIIGIYGGYIVSIFSLGFSEGSYLKQTWDILEVNDVVSGLVKASMFGFIVTIMGCYHGFNSGRGAQGVGAATTYAVVSASILILISNFILTKVFFS